MQNFCTAGVEVKRNQLLAEADIGVTLMNR